ncbi:hypothetical protein J1N35_019545 [Gossypium stocksii]|uniref:Reverse transcriptase domain-containing protein n=1 Tax=Gossypium stocksii TaxID=47602 RepID=A0A9D4A7P7_9ROSI|nr:hypothetical protein J1N35_019545 [Gossypium stocksii]
MDFFGSNRFAQVDLSLRQKLENVLHHEKLILKKVFNGGAIEADLNNTLIVLIPKVANLKDFGQFRPISLYYVLCKLVIKVIHSMRCQKNRERVTIKMDLEKAYDRVRWNFIHASLHATDDLVIFSKADLVHSRIIKDILDQFCGFSGHLINARKTNNFFSRGVDDSSANTISSLFGFQKVRDLGRYLRVPLFHQRVTDNTLNFVVEKAREKLHSWDSKKLSIAGHVTLAQLVLLTISSYFMQSMMIPRKTSDEIESLVKQFIWGSSDNKKKMSLVR